MTEVMKADVRQPGVLEQGLEGAVAEVGGVDKGAVLRGEDEAAGLVEGTYALGSNGNRRTRTSQSTARTPGGDVRVGV